MKIPEEYSLIKFTATDEDCSYLNDIGIVLKKEKDKIFIYWFKEKITGCYLKTEISRIGQLSLLS